MEREIRLYDALVKQGVDVTFLTWGGAEDEEIAKTLPQFTVIPIYKYIPRPKNKALRALVSLKAPFALREIIQEADVLKTNQMWGAWVAVIAKIWGFKPLVLRCGFELYHFTLQQGKGFLRRVFTWLISFLSYQLSDRICVATQEDKDFVKAQFKVRDSKIDIHPNWVDTDLFCPQETVQKAGRILFVGRLNAQKNLEKLIGAVAGTPYTLDIIGTGELRDSLEKLAAENGASVNFLGTVPNDKLPGYYNAYPVYILPSHYEGNPKTLLEAMACGSAILGTDVPGIRNVITHEKTGLLCKEDALSLRAGIERLMGDEALRKRLGRAAREQIAATQSLDILVQKEHALLEQCVFKGDKVDKGLQA